MEPTSSPASPPVPAHRGRVGFRWYQVVYHLIYRLRLIIWQRPHPPADLVRLVEGPAALPAGRALDLGCGTGTDTTYLASHGWQVTAIDMVPKALAMAERRASTAGVTARFIAGDVTRLSDLDIGDGYHLVVDFGCFHTLPDDRRTAYVTSVTQVVADRATLLLYGFHRAPKMAPMHAGISAEEIQQRFCPAGWDLDHADQVPAAELGIGVRRADQRFEVWRFQLHRTSRST